MKVKIAYLLFRVKAFITMCIAYITALLSCILVGLFACSPLMVIYILIIEELELPKRVDNLILLLILIAVIALPIFIVAIIKHTKNDRIEYKKHMQELKKAMASYKK